MIRDKYFIMLILGIGLFIGVIASSEVTGRISGLGFGLIGISTWLSWLGFNGVAR